MAADFQIPIYSKPKQTGSANQPQPTLLQPSVQRPISHPDLQQQPNHRFMYRILFRQQPQIMKGYPPALHLALYFC